MELRVVTEMLALLPEGIHVWVSSDSASVKKGIAAWMADWADRGWRTAQGTPVANRDHWNQLIHAEERHTRIQWAWLKAHSGLLLNECADVLATRGIFNKPHQNYPHQVMVPAGEDTDSMEYTLENGEETPSENWKKGYPPERTYIRVDQGHVSICPPMILEPGSGAHFRHVADILLNHSWVHELYQLPLYQTSALFQIRNRNQSRKLAGKSPGTM
jgi:hypothetical protein